LLLKAGTLQNEGACDELRRRFVGYGLDGDRLELRGPSSHLEMLEQYGEVDIALDPFPFNGGMTTLEALWMGVPVVSLAGTAHMSRVGATILRCAGLNEFVAGSLQEYAAIAIALAHDQAQRESLRGSLRNKLLASPLLDHEGFTRKLERHFSRVTRS